MFLVYQLNTDTDSFEQFGQPIGHTAEASIEILTRQAKVIGLTDLVYNTTADNDERVGNYLFTATGNHPDGYEVKLFLQPLVNLD